MTWLALADHDDRRLSLRGLGTDKRAAPVLADNPGSLLSRGSILFETRLSPDGRPQMLFGHKATDPVMRSLTFQAIPGGGIAMVQVHGDAIAHAALQHRPTGRADVVRVTYSWDAPTRWGRLTLERPEDIQVVSVPVPDPRPPSLRDLRHLFLGQEGQTFAPDMIFAALSDQIEAVGPMPTLLPATPLATPSGYRAAGELRRGDTVTTRRAGTVPVLHRLSRMVPARGSFAPVRLRAPYFGLQQDLIVAPDQRLLIDGPEVEYLFGQEAVLVPARHLVNGFAALAEPCGPTILYTQLLLPGHETLLAAGTALESLYIGRIRRDSARLGASVLHHLARGGLPEHGRPAHHVLRWYDAIHLARQRAA
jgi:hypothetical protein